MVRESRVVAGLLLDDVSADEWDSAIKVENVLQKRSPSSAWRNAQSIRQRLERLGPGFWQALRYGDDELATQVAFAAALERNLLMVEFMEQVLRDCYVTQLPKIAAYQWLEFLDDCAHRDPLILEWKDSSKNKMREVVFRMLAETGYLKSTRSLQLQPVLVRVELRSLLDEHYKRRIKQCMEVSSRRREVQ